MVANLIGNLLGGFANSYTSTALAMEQMEQQYKYNMNLQHDAQDWQERMSNTAHRREVEDLKAAGLNPILSANQGANAYSTGLNSVDQAPLSSGFSSAMQNSIAAEQTKSNIRLNDADAGLRAEQQNLVRQQANTESIQQRMITAKAIEQELKNPYINDQQKIQLKQMQTEIGMNLSSTALNNAQIGKIASDIELNSAKQIEAKANAGFQNRRASGYSYSESESRGQNRGGSAGAGPFKGSFNTGATHTKSRSRTW